MAACVILPPNGPRRLRGLNDSKRLTELVRERLFDRIPKVALAYGIASVEHDEIDRINILQASLRAMERSLAQALQGAPASDARTTLVAVDGRIPIRTTLPQRAFVKGDQRSHGIAAASVLAKVTRDRRMVALDATYPGYGFAQHKGYPTAAHRDALRRLGPSPIHRRTFRLLPD